ncbi:hypothetical protein BBJ29_005114 [Phytophthora kernoviae]|uniref:Amino acid transporter n=1 Tax=Phytophthora kernoviae TaxID=325452 RepID=A0A421FTL3_9STRA|nr:hypothetical protein BBJ29_005114 [Phytophthora kernoviae]
MSVYASSLDGALAPRSLTLALGLGIGVIVSLIVALSGVRSTVAVRWLLRLPGELYLNAFTGLTLPLVALKATLTGSQLAQEATDLKTLQSHWLRVGGITLMGFAVASLLASAIGASVAVALRGIIPHTKVLAQAWRLSSGATVAFSCPSDVVNGSLALRSDGTLMCSENTTTFVLHDVARTFVVESEAIAPSVAEQLVSVAESVFPVSLPGAFLNGDVLSLVMGGLALGVALVRLASTNHTEEPGHEDDQGEQNQDEESERKEETRSVLLQLVAHAEAVVCSVLIWMQKYILVGAGFMVCSVLLRSSSPEDTGVSSIAAATLALVAVLLFALVLDVVVMLTLATLLTQSNPFAFLRHVVSAQLLALSSGSSLVALPATVSSVIASKCVSPPLAFVVCAASTVLSQTGTALYLSVTTLFVLTASASGMDSSDLVEAKSAGAIVAMVFANALIASVLSPLPAGGKTAALATTLGAIFGVATGPLDRAAFRAAAAGIPAESIETATTTTSSLPDHEAVGSMDGSGRDREPLTMTMSPSATAQFRDPMETFNGPKRIPWPGAMAHAHATIDAQDDLLVDLYYKTPSLWLTTAAGAVGVVAGGLLNKYSISENAQLWIGLMGTLLIRALECLTLPLMFTSVTTCFSNLVVSNKTRPVMMRLAIYFVLAALLSSCVAIAVAFCFAGYFTVKPDVSPATTNFQFILRCPNGKLFSRVGECTAQSVRDGQILTATNVTGLPDALQQSLAATSGVFPGYQSLAAQIVEFFGDFFTENITEAFVVVQFLGITIFSMIIGATIMKVYDPSSGELNHALVLTRQIHVVLEMILNWLVPYIPLGTLSMMSFSIMTGEFSQQAMRDSFYFTLAMVVALLVNFFAVACVFYAILVRRNPLKFVWFLMPGVIYMLATGNYLATVPVLMRSLEKSQQVSRTLAQFTICMGVSLCLCGTAIFFVVASIFMAYTSGLNEVITPGRSIGLILAATASSIGTPLVPGSALTFTCTIWRTLFTDQVPGSFVYIVAVEWIMYRLRRTYNIIVAAFIARILAEQLDETVEDEEDRVYLDQQLGMTNGPQL